MSECVALVDHIIKSYRGCGTRKITQFVCEICIFYLELRCYPLTVFYRDRVYEYERPIKIGQMLIEVVKYRLTNMECITSFVSYYDKDLDEMISGIVCIQSCKTRSKTKHLDFLKRMKLFVE